MSAQAISGNSNVNFTTVFDREPLPERPREIRVLPHHFFGSLNIPGMFNLFYIPSEFMGSLRDQVQAERLGDIEGSYENWLKILEVPFNATSSVFSNVGLVVRLLSYLHLDLSYLPVIAKIAKITPILGLIVCAFEAGIEIRGLTHAASMLKLIEPFEKLNDNPEEMDKALFRSLQRLSENYCDDMGTTTSIQNMVDRKFPHLDPEQKEEKMRQYRYLLCGATDRSLIRRVHSRCAQKVHNLVPQLIQEYGRLQPNERAAWRGRAVELLTDVKMQSYKKTLMHILGLIAVIITIAGLIATICACPYAIPLALLIVGGALSTAHVCVGEGMMHTYGYKFDLYNLLPDYLKTLYRKIFIHSVRSPVPITSIASVPSSLSSPSSSSN